MEDKRSKTKTKNNGQVYTPDFLVSNILDYVGYTDGNILQKHVIDNSCGDGAFLCCIVDRYCKDYITRNESIYGLKEDLERYIHGIEIDTIAYDKCLVNLDTIVLKFGVQGVKWNILNCNALSVSTFNGIINFVIGNPPYVRLHNLVNHYEDVKSFSFGKDGMTDIYLVFYELGLRMLNKNGKLCYITPSSWLSSLAGTNMRNYIINHKNLVSLIDLGHYQPFEGAITYTMIALFDKQKTCDNIDYYTYSEENKDKVYVDTIPYEEMLIDGKFYVGTCKELSLLRLIKNTKLPCNHAKVKNGFATLADKVFIKELPFSNLTIPVLKASTGKWMKAFFPYDSNGKPLSKEELFSYPEIAEYLTKHKAELLKKQTEKQNPNWYLYGRTQAIKDVYLKKYSINTIIKDIESIKINKVPSGSGVYSGLYILTEAPYEVLESIIRSDDFIDYLKILKHYKSGGYYTYTSKDLEQYINYKLSQNIKKL